MVVTDRRRLMAEGADRGSAWQSLLLEFVRAATLGGADLVQIRERDLDAGPLAAFLAMLAREVPGARATVVLNDRIDVALTAGVAGVHLPERSFSPATARKLASDTHFLVGKSVHSSAAAAAAAGAASYLLAGTVRPTRSKEGGLGTLGWDGLRSVVAAAGGTPVLAIGGMTELEVPAALAAGATGVAAIGAFIPPPGRAITDFVQERVTNMRLAFDSYGSVT